MIQHKKKYKYSVGIDEVGRGPLAGPVTVCAFCISKKNERFVKNALAGITDSKKLTQKQREYYYEKIVGLQESGLATFSVSHVSARVIDRKGIMWALKVAVTRSLKKLGIDNPYVYLDGRLCAPDNFHQETIIKGDQKKWEISAASVIAKVVRDLKMVEYGQKFPKYEFEKHKGYGTKKHREAIQKFGITPIHRASWIKA